MLDKKPKVKKGKIAVKKEGKKRYVLAYMGYIKDKNGHIVVKFDLPKGKHKIYLKEGEEFIEVGNRVSLSKKEVYHPHIAVSAGDKKEALIQERMRELAIKELKEEGKLPKNYK